VLTDHGTRYIDWTCYLSVRSVVDLVNPDAILFHILDGVLPSGQWWDAIAKIPAVKIVPFTSADVPKTLNGHDVSNPAHISDFRRFKVMYDRGGIYLDTDHVLVRPIDNLLTYSSVWGRQGENEKGHQVGGGALARSQRPLTAGAHTNTLTGGHRLLHGGAQKPDDARALPSHGAGKLTLTLTLTR
jgi:hypothetical protein